MLGFLRHSFAVLVGLVLGYLIGSGPLAEWVVDVGNQLGVAWATERATRGPGGTVPLLIAGYLLGQGLFLVARELIKRIGPMRARHTERLASWDPSMKLCTRFGLHQYLEECARWAAEDPTTRTQSLVLFRLHGLGALNEIRGTLETTRMLQHIAAEVRAASLPDSASAFARWSQHYFPSHRAATMTGLPAARCPARWSGATFALAFRELDAVQVVAIAREIANWISKELEPISAGTAAMSLRAAVVIGSPSASGRALCGAAAKAVEASSSSLLRVLCDPADVRVTVISQMNEIEYESVALEQRNDTSSQFANESTGMIPWLREWGPGLACWLGAAVLLRATSSNASAPTTFFPWPDKLTEVQTVDATGPKSIRLVRTSMTDQQTSQWKISNLELIQGRVDDGAYSYFQVHATVTNNSLHTSYLSVYDFAAVDHKQRVITFDPARTLRMAQALTGTWLAPGQSWTGWLLGARRDETIVALQFEPDRSTRLRFTVPLTEVPVATE